MGEVIVKLLQTFFTALIITGSGVALMYSFSTFYNSRTNLNGMINQQVIEKKLERQNEEYYNKLYKRYDKLSRDIDNYQTQTNNRFDYIEKSLDQITNRLDNNKSPININNSSSASVNQ